MKKVFRLLGLIENHTLVLDISKERFLELLQVHVGNDGNSSMDLFSSKHIDYKGVVQYNGFYLRRKRGLFKNTRHFCKAFGTVREENHQLIIDLEFKNFPPPIYMYLGLALFFGLGSVGMFLAALFSFDPTAIGAAFANIFSVLVFFGIIGTIVRMVSLQTIEKMKNEMDANFNRYVMSKV